ncbi:hypothetical protein [Verrucosispora sioxanthis]|uniref:Uncharacterized protein n=1 Tax=Verrucosispora sioxanthis TaxID=2499994 RepID=A0A6M1L4L6_9ACTN|nr:hypothetical protein [Verrucosispora sioxanthis]NEE65101.1 hypothetical protein [Verrucosispora sioxanthis]NGM14211.1 hypothetical protein [Verrucosispora sioxanthis]
MTNPGFDERAAAAEPLVRAVLGKLASEVGTPRIDRLPDSQHWWRYGQESFVGLRPRAWLMPPDVPIVGWLDRFPEMGAVRASYAADPVRGPRVDALLGTIASRTARNFDWLLIQHVIEPMVLSTGSYEFREDVFWRVYAQFELGFGATTVTMVEFLPLNGFESAMPCLELPEGLVLQPMSDAQMDHAISALAVPRVAASGVNGVQVSRLDQWALTRSRVVEVVAGHVDVVPPDADQFPTLREPASLLITALRIVCGGSAITTRQMYAQADDEFPIVLGARAALTSFGAADNARPTHLMPQDADAVRIVYLALGLHTVQQDRSLQVAIRRLVAAGTRNDDGDRLIDLSIAAEALFIQRGNLAGASKGDKIAAGAAQMLGNDPQVTADPTEISDFMAEIYRARSAEIHGDGQPYGRLRRLSGVPTESLALAVADAELVMRRAVHLVLQNHVTARELALAAQTR